MCVCVFSTSKIAMIGVCGSLLSRVQVLRCLDHMNQFSVPIQSYWTIDVCHYLGSSSSERRDSRGVRGYPTVS